MIPTNAQIAEWREIADIEWYEDYSIDALDEHKNCYIAGYIRARTEQLQGLYPVGENVVEVVPAVEDEPIVGFNYILTAIRINVAVQFYNTTFDYWTDLSGTSAEIRERDYHSINRHFDGLDWRIKPSATTT